MIERFSSSQAVSNFTAHLRSDVVRFAKKPLNYRVCGDMHELRKAESLLDSGFGLIVLFNHFSMRDGPLMFHVILSDPVMSRRQIVFPVAWHQAESFGNKLIMAAAHRVTDVALCPVVTTDTLQKPEYKDLPLGHGMGQYMAEAVQVLASGGVVALNPQSGPSIVRRDANVSSRHFITSSTSTQSQ